MRDSQIFCFTYAGGTASFFNTIAKDLPDYSVVGLEYAGHGERRKEPLYADFNELADDLFQSIKNSYANGRYALFGYSMGTISLLEILKRIENDGMKLPDHVFLAAHEPFARNELLNFTDDALDDWIKDRTIRFGAVPDALIENRSFWRVYLPLYRADYSIIAKYKFTPPLIRFEVPATVFYSESDASYERVKVWNKYFKQCGYYQYDGNHFFIQSHHKEMADVINRIMSEVEG